MASLINQLADKLLALNKTLPEGLERRPYYGHDFMLGDDEGDMIDDATRRQLRAKDDAASLRARAAVLARRRRTARRRDTRPARPPVWRPDAGKTPSVRQRPPCAPSLLFRTALRGPARHGNLPHFRARARLLDITTVAASTLTPP